MRRLVISFTATVAILLVGSQAGGSGSKDACKKCITNRHVNNYTNYLNPQPLPPGVKGPGHGGNSANFVTPGRKTYKSYKQKSAN